MGNTTLRAWVIMIGIGALASGTVPAQRTWIVDRCNGPRADFTDLPAAVAAASPGDVLWLYQGCPLAPKFTACHIDKPLTLIGVAYWSPNASGTIASARQVTFAGRLTISGIPAGQRLILSGLAPWYDYGGTYPNLSVQPHGIHAWDCAGQIIMENVWWITGGVVQGRCRFDRCADVIIRGCLLYCRSEPITFEDSSVVIHSSQLFSQNGDEAIGSWFPQSWYGLNSPSQPAVVVRNSDVTISDAAVRGADLRDDPRAWPVMPETEGLIVESGSVTLAGDAILRGGDPFGPIFLPFDARGLIFRDPRSAWLPGGYLTTPTTVNTVTFRWLVQNQSYDVGVLGPPGGFALLAVGSYLTQPIRGPLGDIGIDPGSFAVIGAAALRATDGWAQWRLPLGWQVPVEHVFAFQAGLLDPNGVFSFSRPAPFLVGWGVGRQP